MLVEINFRVFWAVCWCWCVAACRITFAANVPPRQKTTQTISPTLHSESPSQPRSAASVAALHAPPADHVDLARYDRVGGRQQPTMAPAEAVYWDVQYGKWMPLHTRIVAKAQGPLPQSADTADKRLTSRASRFFRRSHHNKKEKKTKSSDADAATLARDETATTSRHASRTSLRPPTTMGDEVLEVPPTQDRTSPAPSTTSRRLRAKRRSNKSLRSQDVQYAGPSGIPAASHAVGSDPFSTSELIAADQARVIGSQPAAHGSTLTLWPSAIDAVTPGMTTSRASSLSLETPQAHIYAGYPLPVRVHVTSTGDARQPFTYAVRSVTDAEPVGDALYQVDDPHDAAIPQRLDRADFLARRDGPARYAHVE